ncbi:MULTISPECIES: ribokinase [Microbacterium]|uniref:ribokinase n=1 Tax=Microbacterium TaxID=33882 RepID=UPI000D656BB9|nr:MULTISPECIES: ribokinase [Microbacterium]
MSNGAENTGRVFVFGSANNDHVLAVEEFPQAGETVLSRSYSVGLGGKGANQAVAAARAGGSVAFVGSVGSDQAGEAILANFAEHGIDARGTARSRQEATGVAIVLVNSHGSNEIVVAAGANADLAASTVEEALAGIGTQDVVVVQCEIPIPRVEQIIRGGARQGATVVVNLAPYAELQRSSFDEVDLLIVNESEARALLGSQVPEHQLAEEVVAAVGCGCVVTLGEHGSVYASPHSRAAHVPAVAVEDVVDTTGAGDVYVGTLAAALARRDDIVAAMELATAAAALSVSSRGAQSPRDPEAAQAVA